MYVKVLCGLSDFMTEGKTTYYCHLTSWTDPDEWSLYQNGTENSQWWIRNE